MSRPAAAMSKRKGLSLEEKREKVLEVLTDSADVFVLKVGVSQLGECLVQSACTQHPATTQSLQQQPDSGAIAYHHIYPPPGPCRMLRSWRPRRVW